MAISGVVDADIVTIANTLGESRSKIASLLGYSYLVKAWSAADHGSGSHQADLTLTNLHGLVTVDWGDGAQTRLSGTLTGGGVLSPTHVYAGAGTYIITITSLGSVKVLSRVIA